MGSFVTGHPTFSDNNMVILALTADCDDPNI